MAEGAYTTLDDPVFRSRLRAPSSPVYESRPLTRPARSISGIAPSQSWSDVKPAAQPKTEAPQPVTMPAPVGAQPAPEPHYQPAETYAYEQGYDYYDESARRRVSLPRVKLPRIRLKNPFKIHSKLQAGLSALAVLLVIGGAYLSFSGWHANKIAQVQAAKLTAIANKVATDGGRGPAGALADVKPSASALASYTVAPNLPRYIMIPKLGVDARVLSVGLTATGAVGTPSNVYDTDWYDGSAQPGQPGAMLIDGHVSSWTAHGVFYGIKTLQPGDQIQVERGDGTIFNYSVVKTQVYSSNNVDMAAAMTPVTAGKPGLNLITCTGDVIPGTSQFNERIIVFAQQD